MRPIPCSPDGSEAAFRDGWHCRTHQRDRANTTLHLAWRNVDDPASPGAFGTNTIGSGISATGRAKTTSGAPGYTSASRAQIGWFLQSTTGGQAEILGGQGYVE